MKHLSLKTDKKKKKLLGEHLAFENDLVPYVQKALQKYIPCFRRYCKSHNSPKTIMRFLGYIFVKSLNITPNVCRIIL